MCAKFGFGHETRQFTFVTKARAAVISGRTGSAASPRATAAA
jgi:hypothetical protein